MNAQAAGLHSPARASVRAAMSRLFDTPLVALSLAVLLAAVAITCAVHALQAPLRTDYLATLTGTSLLAHSGCLYCEPAQLALQRQLLQQPAAQLDAFLAPPFEPLLFRPLLLLSPQGGLLTLFLLSGAGLAASALLAWRRLGVGRLGWPGVSLLAFLVLSVPADWNYLLGQTDALLLLPGVAAAVLLQRGDRTAAGLCLSLLLLKPQVAWLALPALAAARQWRALAGAAAGTAVWLAVSAVVAGPPALSQWIALLAGHGPAVASSIGLPALAAATGGSAAGFTAAAVLGVGACVAAWRWRAALAAQPMVALALGLVASALLGPHVYPYDLVLMLVPLSVLAARRPGTALACAGLLNLAHVADTYLLATSAPLETAVVAALAVALARQLVPRRPVLAPAETPV